MDHGNNPLWALYLLEKVLEAVMENPLLKRDFIKVAEAGEVLTRWSKEYRAGTAEIVQDIRRKPVNVWKKTWCKPDNYARWEAMR